MHERGISMRALSALEESGISLEWGTWVFMWMEVCGQLDTALSPGSQGVFLCGVLKRDDEFLTQWFRDPVKTIPEDIGRSFKVF